MPKIIIKYNFLLKIFLFLTMFVLWTSTKTNAQNEKFFDYQNNLSSSLVNKIFIDNYGFLWAAAEDGLNRLDGNNFIIFSEKNSGLKANMITNIKQISTGNILIATNNGLFVYNYNNGKINELEIINEQQIIHPFVTDFAETADSILISTSGYGLLKTDKNLSQISFCEQLNSQLSNKFIHTIFIDNKQNLWLGSFNNGMCMYNPENKRINNFNNLPLAGNDITSFCQDNLQNIYIGSSKKGLFKITTDGKIEKIKFTDGTENFSVNALYFDSKHQLWVGTDGLGLKKLDPQTQTLESYAPASPTFDFSKSKIHSITEDSNGSIWLAVFQKGVYLLGQESQMFENYGYRAFSPQSIGSNSVGALAINKNETWVGTDGDGIYIIENKKVNHISLTTQNGETLSGNIISFYNQNGKFMWIGTFNEGLLKMDIETKKIVKIYRSYEGNPYNLMSDRVSSMLQYGQDKMLITTYGGKCGEFDTKSEIFTPELPGGIKNSSWANNITIDKNQNLWISMFEGLQKIDVKNNKETTYTAQNGFLPIRTVNCTVADSIGNIWIGTTVGVIIYNPQTEEKQILTDTCGLADNITYGFVQDNNNNMWIATHSGLSKYNLKTKEIKTYTTADGIANNEFTRLAGIKDNNGNVWFGGTKGVTKIYNNFAVANSNPGNVLLTNFLINDKPIHAGDKKNGKIVTEKEIMLSENITINESDNIFTICFAPSCPSRKDNTTFKYRLLGFNSEWKICPTQTSQAVFTNLKHGKYTFEIAAIYKGKQSEIRKLNITILPPWYKTVYAKIGYVVAILAIVAIIVLFMIEKIKRRQDIAVNEMKMQFFINISHEIRTPLTLIIDPLEKLLSKPQDKETERLYKIMQINCGRIYRLVSQLLDLRKIDKGKIMMRFGQTEINTFVKKIIESFMPAAEAKEIVIQQNTNAENIVAWIDPDNFEKILLNLLSNATKFSPVGGKISVNINQNIEKNIFTITVEDSGIGLAPEDIEKIFQRFYQVRNSQTLYNTGTGVGLHLAKYLTEMHKGKLYAENRTDAKGSRFIIEIPLGNKHLPPETLVTTENFISQPTENAIPKNTEQEENSPQEDSETANIKPKTKYKIMLVDDEDGIRKYIEEELSQYYKIISYSNGADAFNNVILDMPDLIISDIMMPQMDGITLCKKLKHKAQTNHIPIILLTALGDEAHKSQGIEIGADMYLVKPLNTEFLKKAIKNLIDNRKRVIDKAENRAENFQMENLQLKSADEILMQKVMTIITENISKRDLNVEMLADNIGISRVHLHRKIKEITGLTARDFIKNIRMKQASYLLTVKKLNISETAYAVGYSNPAHFSASFKSFYGIPPLTYVKNMKDEETT